MNTAIVFKTAWKPQTCLIVPSNISDMYIYVQPNLFYRRLSSAKYLRKNKYFYLLFIKKLHICNAPTSMPQKTKAVIFKNIQYSQISFA